MMVLTMTGRGVVILSKRHVAFVIVFVMLSVELDDINHDRQGVVILCNRHVDVEVETMN